MQSRKYIFIPLMLLVLFMTYQAGIMFFSHIHYVNGVMVVHSHPSADNEHTHTEGQILTFAHVSHWVGTEPVCIILNEVPVSDFYTVQCERKSKVLSDLYMHCISLRAPPFC